MYDMVADPGQKQGVAKENPDVLRSLTEAFEAKVKDVTKAGFDPIPVHVGYACWPVVTLPGHEAYLEPAPRQGISYVGANGWANDWITNWTDTKAFAWWPLKVVAPGRFDVSVLYTCAQANLGTRLRVEVGGRVVEGGVDVAHDPAPLPSPDRVKRGEVYEKVWATAKLGAMALEPGEMRLVLRAVEIPGEQVCDIKAIRLERTT